MAPPGDGIIRIEDACSATSFCCSASPSNRLAKSIGDPALKKVPEEELPVVELTASRPGQDVAA